MSVVQLIWWLSWFVIASAYEMEPTLNEKLTEKLLSRPSIKTMPAISPADKIIIQVESALYQIVDLVRLV